MKVDLSSYDNTWYKPGSRLKRWLWHFVNMLIFKSGLFPFYALKTILLKMFGAQIGRNVVIKPFVNIKYPWFLQVGDSVWIGEEVWIDNYTLVSIGNNVCLSQGALLLTGNHNFLKPSFDLVVKKIIIEDGVWIGAKAVVCPGVTCRDHSVLSVGSVATKDLERYSINGGNPAKKIKDRIANHLAS